MKRNILITLMLLLAAAWVQPVSAQCTSDAGTVNTGTYELCTNDWFNVVNQGAVVDTGDVRRFVIHDGTATQLGNILVSSAFNSVGFSYLLMTTGIPYQMAVLVGDDLGQGQIDLNDPCLSMAGGITLVFLQTPQLLLDVTGELSCNGPAIEIIADAFPIFPEYEFNWNGPGNTFGGGLANAITIPATQPGDYTVTVMDPVNGCADLGTITVLADTTYPTASIAISNNTCGEATFTAQTNNPANTYLWSNGVTNPDIFVNQSGQYCVTVTSPEGCTAVACESFITSDSLTVEILPIGNNICADSLGLFAEVSGANPASTSYLWNNGSTWSWLQPFNAGWYSVTVTNPINGCTATDSYFLETDIDDCGTLEGTVYADFNTDCLLNAGDEGLQQFVVRIQDAAGEEYFAYTGQDGQYQLSLPPGSYTVGVVLSSGIWMPCQAVYVVDIQFGGTTTQDIPLQPEFLCPDMQVDVSTGLVRRCNTTFYHVSYCNQGTSDGIGAYVEIELDPFFTLQEAEIPFSDLGNNLYRFDLGDVPFNSCEYFWIKVFVGCDAQLGQTHCVEAEIFPHDPCPQTNPEWSGASVELTAECNGNELLFRAKNTGSSAMTTQLDYVIIEDAVMLMMTPGDPLGAGEERLVFTAPANGATWRLEAEQEPFHPGNSMPSLSVEGCASGQTFSLGYVNQYESDDADPWKDIDCRENVGSWDPNDKQGFPTGYGTAHYIKRGVDLEYLIRFQNTGTDTAFLVVIRDTLSAALDPGSVVPGASSHPYRFDYFGDGYLKFVFDPIALPDSNVNVEGSQGFVSFKVSQKPDLPLETDIFNQAAIYFDANAPVITNTTQHRIGEQFVTVSTWTPAIAGLELLLTPNPASDYAVLQVKGLPAGTEWQVELLDAMGRKVHTATTSNQQWRLERGALPAGMYLLRISSEGRYLGAGKLMLR